MAFRAHLNNLKYSPQIKILTITSVKTLSPIKVTFTNSKNPDLIYTQVSLQVYKNTIVFYIYFFGTQLIEYFYWLIFFLKVYNVSNQLKMLCLVFLFLALFHCR